MNYPNKLMILSVLRENDGNGYDILEKLKLESEERYLIKDTQLYMELGELEAQNYITSYERFVNDEQSRRFYMMTEQGYEEYERLVRDWEELKKCVDTILRSNS